MYPKVLVAYAEAKQRYGPIAALPTPAFFYGMQPGDEVGVDIEPGKRLVIRLAAIGETEEDGTARVFFELNGQPRFVTVADRKAAGKVAVRRTADPGNNAHVSAPMPGLVAMVSVTEGQAVKAGDQLLTLEAMKMEAAITAPHDGKVAELLVRLSQNVEAKDLLLVLEPA